jgi:two-component system, OmpR family, sensor histidine kinase VicK
MAILKDITIQYKNMIQKEIVINGNSTMLIRVFNNILSNSVKFTAKGGIIILEYDFEDENNVKITILDNGIGIPKEFIPELFNKYSKTSRQGTNNEKSTGLGLYISKGIIDQHGGAIKVTSEVGKGTRTKIVLPIIEGSSNLIM